MRRIRVRTVQSAVTYDLFEGFVVDWGQTWLSRVQNNSGAAEHVREHRHGTRTPTPR
jgi:hypothetical protein